MSAELSWKISKARSSMRLSNTGGAISTPAGRFTFSSSGCGKVTCGGDRAASRERSLHGTTANGPSSLKARAARFSRNILKPLPSKEIDEIKAHRHELPESRVGINQVADILQRKLTGGHRKPKPRRVALYLHPLRLLILRKPSGQEIISISDQQPPQRILYLSGHYLRRETGAGGEEVNRLHIKVKHFVDVGQEHRTFRGFLRRKYETGVEDCDLEVVM
nr:unknown [Ipomoea trifida]